MAALHPLLTIPYGVDQVFVTCNTKSTTVFELLDQWDDVKVEKAKLSRIPMFGWILRTATPIPIGLVALLEQALIPLAVDIPVLHPMGDNRSLHQMLENDCRLSIPSVLERFSTQLGLAECLFPSGILNILGVLIHHIHRQYHVDHELTETTHLGFSLTDCSPERAH